jgi:hypothetical protein
MTFQLAPVNIMILSCIYSGNIQPVRPFFNKLQNFLIALNFADNLWLDFEVGSKLNVLDGQ